MKFESLVEQELIEVGEAEFLMMVDGEVATRCELVKSSDWAEFFWYIKSLMDQEKSFGIFPVRWKTDE